MVDALTQNLTLSPFEDHICPHCEQLVPKKILNILGIEKVIQPRCKCEAENDDKERQAPVDLKAKRDIESRFSISSLGERFSDSTFDSFKPMEGTEKAYERCRDYAVTYNQQEEGLLIWGEYGNGKSHLVASIAHEIKSKGYTVVFQTLPELLERIRQTFNDRSNRETEKQIMDALLNCELLVLDDVGAEKVSDWVQDVLFRIVDGRYRKKKPILYTSNLKPSELKDRVGGRIYDRMIETSIMVQNTATSYRMKIAEERFRGMGA